MKTVFEMINLTIYLSFDNIVSAFRVIRTHTGKKKEIVHSLEVAVLCWEDLNMLVPGWVTSVH